MVAKKVRRSTGNPVHAARTIELKALGWKSTGDIPYAFERDLRMNSARLLTWFKYIRELVLSKMGDEREEYEKNNIEQLGRRCYFSPDMQSKMKEEAQHFFALPPSERPRSPSTKK